MPAARRYKQSLLDELKEAIRSLPPGEPPEAEHSTQDALKQLEEDIRRKILDEHVDVSAIVDLLNARGFNLRPRDVLKVAQPKTRSRRKRSSATAAGKGKGTRNGNSHGGPMLTPQSGSFEVRPDEDDI